MKVCGIICEYNPFHNGHFLHLRETRKILGDDTAIICCMSGNYVQRGEPAIVRKHLRASAAISCGADLIIELPSAYALLSAEGFAFSGVYLLDSLGVVTHLSFGAETDDVSVLSEISDILSEHETVQKTLMEMKSGISYAAAREKALYASIKEKSALLSTPNNILAVEYIKAIKKLSSPIVPVAIKRIGVQHDSKEASNELLSASEIRNKVLSDESDSVCRFMPDISLNSLSDMENLSSFDSRENFYRSMFSYLLRLKPEDFSCLPDVSEGLEYRICHAIRSSCSVDEALSKAQTRRYPLARIRRIMLRAYLNLPGSLSDSPPPYCRVLGFSEKGRELLGIMRKTARIPILTKQGHISKLSKEAQMLFDAESVCTDLYCSALTENVIIPGSEWRKQAIKPSK